ncbi:MAG: T9SS type A sorting domain-containing protein, partial [Bacteroidia bacterium]
NTGNFIGAISVGGVPDSVETLGYESGIAVCAEPTGEVYATGSLLSGGVFGTTNISKYGRTDIFITKISQLSNVNTYAEHSGTFHAYPNPSNGTVTLVLNKQPEKDAVLTVFDCYGQTIAIKKELISSEISIDLSEQKSGVYFIEMKQQEAVSRKKIVIQK